MSSPPGSTNSPLSSSPKRREKNSHTRSSAVIFNSSDLSSTFHTLTLKHKDLLTEQKLLDSFFYFKDEFILLSQQLSIALPLDLVEDKSFSIYSFASIDGPKYIFQVISTRFSIVRLARPGLTLLILFITYLRRHFNGFSKGQNFTLDGNNQWIKDFLPKLIDYFPLNNIISILVNSQVNIIQELILTFLSGLLELIPQISHHLFSIPYFIQQQIQSLNFNFHSFYRQKHLKELELAYHNKINSVHASALTIKRRNNGTLEKINHEEPFQDLFLEIMMSDQDFFNDTLIINDPKKGQAESNSSSYLSYKYDQLCLCSLAHILTISMIQKNRHFIISSCADIIIAICKKKLPWYYIELIARVPSCPILLDNLNNNASNNSNSKGMNNSFRYSENNNNSSKSKENNAPNIDTSNLMNSKIVDWAGIRILLKFLFRFHQLFQGKISNYNSEDEDNLKNISSNSNSDLKYEFQYTHDRVLLAVCSLIYYSNTSKFTGEPLDQANVSQFTSYLTPSLIDLPIENSQSISIFLCKLPGSVDLLKISMSKSNFFDEKFEKENITSDNLNYSDSKFIISKAIEVLSYQFEAYNQFLFRISSNFSSLPSYLSENSIGSRSQTPGNSFRMNIGPLNIKHGISRPGSSSKVSRPNSKSTSRPSTSNSYNDHILNQKLKFVKVEKPSISHISASYNLANNSNKNFDAIIKTENEKFSLFLQNQAQDIMQGFEKPSKYLQSSTNMIQRAGILPLKSTANKLEDDSLLVNTFDVIDKNLENQVILNQSGQQITETSGAVEISNSKGENKYRVAIRPSLYDDLEIDSSISISSLSEGDKPVKSNVSEYRDFFSKISTIPKIPIRLEPKDIIVPNEDISKIRKKFQALAEDALSQAAKQDVGLRHLSKKPIGACATNDTKVVYNSLKSPGTTMKSRPGTSNGFYSPINSSRPNSTSNSRPNSSSLSRPLTSQTNEPTNNLSMYNLPFTRPTTTSNSADKKYQHLDYRSVNAYSQTSKNDDENEFSYSQRFNHPDFVNNNIEEDEKQAELDKNQEEAISSSSFLPLNYSIKLQSDPYNDLNEALTNFQPLLSSVPPPKSNPTQLSFIGAASMGSFSESQSSIFEEKSSTTKSYHPKLTHDYATDLVL